MYVYSVLFILIIITIVWKWNWIKSLFSKKVLSNVQIETITQVEPITKVAPVTVFAVNDNGNFDLMDVQGNILNIGFGPNPKTYINLLDQSEKDTENQNGTFHCKLDSKLYEIGGKQYLVDFTRLT